MNPANPINTRNLIILCFLLFAILFCIPLSLEAKVTGVCSNCHTMHNSQNGSNMQFLATGETDTGPKGFLLRATCIGCHGQNVSGTQNIISSGNIPQVWHNALTDLAGGNFGYVSTKTGAANDKGHNVTDLGTSFKETVLTAPPGDQHSTGITNNNFTCAGIYGCHGDRNQADKLLAMKGAHHTDDSVLKFGSINISAQGGSTGLSYRFLKGVKGGEDADWQATSSTTDHNEYFGATSMGNSSATDPANNTISGFCAECHGNFHGDGSSGDPGTGTVSPWLRHPTDISLPSSGEYTAYTAYSTIVPVARTTIPNSPSATVTPSGTTDDMVMCLSCHRAHASPYFKIMRWDYKSSTLSTALSGCNVCHTSKN